MDAVNTNNSDDKNGFAIMLAMPVATLLALLSASCCVLPIGLSILGLGGTWLAILGPFIAYRSFILSGIAIALFWAWYRVLRAHPCGPGRRSSIIWVSLATTAFLIAASSSLWEGAAQRYMWDLWRSTL